MVQTVCPFHVKLNNAKLLKMHSVNAYQKISMQQSAKKPPKTKVCVSMSQPQDGREHFPPQETDDYRIQGYKIKAKPKCSLRKTNLKTLKMTKFYRSKKDPKKMRSTDSHRTSTKKTRSGLVLKKQERNEEPINNHA